MVFYRNAYSRGGNIIEDVPALCLYLSSSLYISHKRPAIIGPDISLPIYQKIWDKSSLFPPMACISNPCNEEPSTSAMFVDPMILVSKPFPLFFSLVRKEQGKVLSHLVQQFRGVSLGFLTGVCVNIHCGRHIRMTKKLLHVLRRCAVW